MNPNGQFFDIVQRLTWPGPTLQKGINYDADVTYLLDRLEKLEQHVYETKVTEAHIAYLKRVEETARQFVSDSGIAQAIIEDIE